MCISCMLLILPIQCKGVVELHMWVCHGVKGRKLLQSLHQLHDGLIILDDKWGTQLVSSYSTFTRVIAKHCSHESLHQCPPKINSNSPRYWAALRPESEFLMSHYSFCQRINWLLNTKNTSISVWPLHHIFVAPTCLHSNYTQSMLNNSTCPWCLLF